MVESELLYNDLYFDDYVRDVMKDITLHVAADDPRVRRASTLMLFDMAENDRSLEANLLASVAEEYGLEPEDMMTILQIRKKITLNN